MKYQIETQKKKKKWYQKQPRWKGWAYRLHEDFGWQRWYDPNDVLSGSVWFDVSEVTVIEYIKSLILLGERAQHENLKTINTHNFKTDGKGHVV